MTSQIDSPGFLDIHFQSNSICLFLQIESHLVKIDGNHSLDEVSEEK